jgi:hypothetical protein
MFYAKMFSLCLRVQATAREKKLLKSQGCPEGKASQAGQLCVKTVKCNLQSDIQDWGKRGSLLTSV